MPTLKPRYEAFCRHYVATCNAGEAALQAGYSAAGRYKQGYRLLRRPTILARIAELRAEIAERDCRSETALLAKLEAAHQMAAHARKPHWVAEIVKAQASLPALLAKSGSAGAATTPATDTLAAALVAMAKQLGLSLPPGLAALKPAA